MDGKSANLDEQYSQGKKYLEYMQSKNPLTEEQKRKVETTNGVLWFSLRNCVEWFRKVLQMHSSEV